MTQARRSFWDSIDRSTAAGEAEYRRMRAWAQVIQVPQTTVADIVRLCAAALTWNDGFPDAAACAVLVIATHSEPALLKKLDAVSKEAMTTLRWAAEPWLQSTGATTNLVADWLESWWDEQQHVLRSHAPLPC